MPRTRPIGITFDRFLERLSELILRDPLAREFMDFPHFDRYHTSPDWNSKVSRQYRSYQTRLRRKWGVDVTPVPPSLDKLPDSIRAQLPQCLLDKPSGEWDRAEQWLYIEKAFAAGVRPDGVIVSGSFWPLQWTVNRGCITRPLRHRLLGDIEKRPAGFWDSVTQGCNALAEGQSLDSLEDWNGYHCKPCFGLSGLSMNEAHILTVNLDLAHLTTRNLDDLAKEFKRIVRHVLPAAPKPSRELDAMWGFLWKASPVRFDRALKAYDLHMLEGWPFAAIARQLRVSTDLIEKDVQVLYQAIYRKKYSARRRRLDAPAQGVPPYQCPQHNSACPASCAYMKKWLQRVNRTLPTDHTGS